MEMSGLGFPYWIAVRRRFVPHDPFFVTGNIERELLSKQVAIDLTEDERHQIHNIEDADIYSVYCPIASCGVRLNCLEEFEDHYHSRHMSACAICSRVYPTSRLLSIHVSESHDSFFAAKVARGFPMYECLVEGCGAKLKSYEARKQHLIDKHKFPPSFEFKRAKPSKQRRRQINQHRQQQKYQQQQRQQQDARMEEDENSSFILQQKKKNLEDEDEAHCAVMEVEELDELVSSVSRLSASDSAPSSASFGRRHARAFAFLPRSLRRDPKHRSDAME